MWGHRLWPAIALAMAAAPCAAAPLAAYGSLPTIEQVAISPDGQLLALDFTKGEQRTIVVQSLTEKKIVTGLKMGEEKIRGLQWAGNDHLIITTSVTSKVMDVAVDTSEWYVAEDFNLATHTQRPLLGDSDLSLNTLSGEPVVRMLDGKPVVFVEGTHFVDTESGDDNVRIRQGQLALFRVDLDVDHSTLISQGDEGATNFVVGADGRPAAKAEYDATAGSWAIKVWSNGNWRETQERTVGIETPELLGLGRDGKSILIGEQEEGHESLRELSPDGATLSDPLPVDGWDELLYDPIDHRLIGVSYLVGDELRYTFFDPADQLEWRAIAAAFPGQSIALVSASDDRKALIVHVDSPTDGPGFALVDLKNHDTVWLGAEYPDVTAADIGPVQPVSFKASDGLEITGYLTLPHGRDPKKLPLVVFPHGGPAARDEPGFDWWAQAMADQGYAVLQVNYRGSEGFGWKFQSAGFGEWGQKMQTDLSDGVRYLAAQGTIDPARVCIVGASYGGYAAAAGATLDLGVYRCAVDVEGPVDLSKFVAWSKSRSGVASQRYWDRYMGAKDLADPHLQAISPAEHADKATIPMLIIHGKDDTVVPFEQAQMMADALAKAGHPAQLVILNHEDHWLSRSDTRLQMLQATVDFLEKNNPPT